MPKKKLTPELELAASVIKAKREDAIGPNGPSDANRVSLYAVEDVATRIGRSLKDHDPHFDILTWCQACGMTR